jgi:porin
MFPKTTNWAAAVLLLLFPFALPAQGGAGVDVTLEGSAGLSGAARHGGSLDGLVLIHSDWTNPGNSPESFQYRAYGSILALVGRGPTGRYLGDFLAASNTEGHPSLRLYSWWLEASRQGWSLRAGLLLADEEFAGTDAGGKFFNSAFGWPAFISANTVNTGPAFYVAAPGIRLERKWGERAAWRVGLYDGDSFDSPTGDPAVTRHGLHYRIGGNQGWFLMTEATYAPGGATRFKAGAWLHTATFSDVRDDASGQPFAVSGNTPREYSSNHGCYAAIEQTLAGKSGEVGNVEFFVRAGFSPADRNALGWALDTGLTWTGLIPGRPVDVVALGLANARFSPRFSAGACLADPASPAPDFEQVIEAKYSLTLNEHLSLQPDLQYIRHPGGSTAQRDALICLLRLNASY